MALTEKQKAIINFALANESKITKKDAMHLIGRYYYHNSDKHVGEVLSRMVKAGLLTRESPGKYLVGKGKTNGKQMPQLPNQVALF